MTLATTTADPRYLRARKLGLYGLLENWQAVRDCPWLEQLLTLEEGERQRRSLERRLRRSRIGRFKPMADFDYAWAKKIDREQIEDLFTLAWLAEGTNLILVGPNGVGKTMIAHNLAHHALLRGATVVALTASELLNDLAAQDGATALRRRLRRYAAPQLLCIDELGYLSYDHRHADLLFEVVTSRYGKRSTLITTNKPFTEWNQIFPSATSVVTLIDRLVHHAEIVQIHGNSYRVKEATEETVLRHKQRLARRRARRSTTP